DHRVDGVLEREDLTLDVDGDLAAEIAARDGGGDLGDVADLAGEVSRHRVDVVGEAVRSAGDALDPGLAALPAHGADLAGDATLSLHDALPIFDHRVDRVLEREDLALDVDGDLAAEIAAGDRGRHLGDVADLAGQVRRHRVDVVGEVL